ncbi:MAG: LysR family transcriptional regulator [Actinomycetota bacterium]
MEVRQLEYFVAVVEEANFTRAAERVRVSQSGVSAQIRRLERELGQTLLDRSERIVRVTGAGATILPYARAALAAIAGARQAADELAGLVRGHVAVGMATACTVSAWFDQLAGFHVTHPGVVITLTEDTSDRLVEGVLSGRLDLALAGLAASVPTGLGSQTVADERLVAAVRQDDPLAASRTITIPALNERSLLCLTRGTGVRTSFDEACAAHGLQAHVTFEASAPDVVAGLAIRGLGVAILTESMAHAHRSDLHAITIVGQKHRARLELIWKAGDFAPPAAAALIDHARHSLASSA